jgi:hypothetical protein
MRKKLFELLSKMTLADFRTPEEREQAEKLRELIKPVVIKRIRKKKEPASVGE